MLKTHYRDYATEAYRLHARLGSAAAYKRRVLAEALARRAESGGSVGSAGPGSPTEAAVVRAEAALAETEGTIRDLEAVERAMERIGRMRGGTCILRAVRERPEMKILFSVSKNVTSEDLKKAIRIIEALQDSEDG